jgi:diguanylate cyclase (GGDEF)-like protein
MFTYPAGHFLRFILPPIATGIVYFLAAAITFGLVGGSDGVAILWPASGILLAILLSSGWGRAYRHVIAATAASLFANLLAGNSFGISFGFTIANISESVAAAWFLSRQLTRRLSFSEPSDLVRFCSAAAMGSALSATIALVVAPVSSIDFWLSWFSTDLLGILIVTPLAMIGANAVRTGAAIGRAPAVFEAIVIFALVAIISWLVFSRSGPPILFLPMLAVLMSASRLGPTGAAGGVLIVAGVSTFTFNVWSPAQNLFGIGPLAKSIYLQFYLLTLFAAALPIAALLSSRNKVGNQLAEEKRLLELAEEAANLGHWHLDVRTNKIVWSREVFSIFGLEDSVPPPLEGAINAYHPDDRQIVTNHIDRAIEHRCDFDFTARIVRPNGEIRHVRSRGEIDNIESDGSFGLFGIVQDITIQVSHAAAIEKARSRAEEAARQAQAIAETDQLTGIANRRRTTSELVQAVLAARREDRSLAITVFDVDHFKRVNDTYGHHAGDEVLKRVANVAANALRAGDMVGRFGGEEFVIILPDTTARTAILIAERVRSSIAMSGSTPRVTVSMGIAELAEGETGESLLRRADEALYVAKRAGRNTLRSAT